MRRKFDKNAEFIHFQELSNEWWDPNGKFKVFIDSNLQPGVLNLAEAKLKGKSEKEIFFSTNICHPSMANNELSGPVLSSALLRYIKYNYKKTYFSYRWQTPHKFY